jgi:DNA-binding transcriptional ArsR family regulator
MFCGVPATTMAALADDTRMGIVEALAARDHTVTELVDLFPISQPAISRHLRVLREAGVVESQAVGKLRIYRLNPDALRDVSDWTDRCRRAWEARFDALGKHLDHIKEKRGAR